MTVLLARKAPPLAADLLPPDEDARIQLVVDAAYQRMLIEMHHLVADALELDPSSFRLDDAATRAILDHAATRVVGISETTRSAIRDVLIAGQRDGLSTFEIAEKLDHLFTVTWRSRAETVARTELGEAQRVSAIDRYRASGLVEYVRIRDGDDDEPCKSRNGTLASLDNPPQLAHPNCLPGFVSVVAPQTFAGAARYYHGEVVVIRTAANDLLTCTPNHPILTDCGWLPAKAIREGYNVLRSSDSQRVAAMIDPDDDHTPTRIQQVVYALGPACGGTSTTMPTTAEDFHGDAVKGDVYVVRTNRRAGRRVRWEHVQQLLLDCALVGLRALFAQSAALQVVIGPGHATNDAMRRMGKRLSLLRSASQRRESLGFTAGPSSIAGFSEPAGNRRKGDADTVPDLLERFPGLIAPVQVVNVEHRPFRGHVYNLQTQEGWYMAENIITHNCTLILVPVVKVDA